MTAQPPPPDELTRLLTALETHEAAVGFFYSLCARKFYLSASLWELLSREEADHAQWVRALARRRSGIAADLKPPAGLLERVEHEIAWVRSRLSSLESGKLTETDAVTIALKLEETIAERELASLLGPSAPPLSRLTDALEARSREHRERIELFYKLRE